MFPHIPVFAFVTGAWGYFIVRMMLKLQLLNI
jgi:hypothetical protein